MCGIAGLFLPRRAPIAEAAIDAMLAVMRHRGPNGTGRFTGADWRFQSGFTRLAIIDLATGDQPIVENGGERVLLGNGEIYNYIELRREEANYPYQTNGDMETVLPLATRYGVDFVHRLNGIYALALYDRKDHRLLLVRDRLGVKPLYWTRLAGGGILFASEIKALFASGLIKPEVNEAAVSSYLAHGYVPAPQTLFLGVNKLSPGHMMTAAADGSIKTERYWRATAANNMPTSQPEAGEHLLGLLRDSIRLQLRSDVPLGALLSGGIDSGLMVALAAEQSAAPLNTYTVSFEGSCVDEAPLAESIARRYATNHTRFRLPAGAAADYLPKLVWHCEEPLNDAALLPNYLIEKFLSRHVTVALNGTGGDELFAGYGRYFRLPVEARYLRLPEWLRQGVIEPVASLVSPMTAWKLQRAALFNDNRGDYLHQHGAHFPRPMRRLIGNKMTAPTPAQNEFFAEFQGPPQSAALYAELNTYLPEDLLTLLDKTSMAVSVEGRVPFLDHRLVEAALAVPPELRTPGGRQKGLERAIAAPFLPEEVLNAPKQGFASPVPAWLKAGLASSARRILTRRETLDRGWWTAQGIERLLAKPDLHGFRVYSLLMLELSIRIHIEGPFLAEPPEDGLEALADAA
ncbi:MAG: asparagine synthase (glutamine-hydrolyzing) [Rhodospirillales bacterium RIFCSPLOWO2_12_FULL_58_28]|nr:MAG: asparagine synthase (glutamine-hydrolyzing) [Rhodospirillales bacterium RIFCSPLOWO2_02_FULL_58_16]OHC76698.1 MAG: asparagine synthase (glutamine-hydrolyzing) [Rhodospirillales bacterium RIFCSPLOWO2_12_FULL_58_28]